MLFNKVPSPSPLAQHSSPREFQFRVLQKLVTFLWEQPFTKDLSLTVVSHRILKLFSINSILLSLKLENQNVIKVLQSPVLPKCVQVKTL